MIIKLDIKRSESQAKSPPEFETLIREWIAFSRTCCIYSSKYIVYLYICNIYIYIYIMTILYYNNITI